MIEMTYNILNVSFCLLINKINVMFYEVMFVRNYDFHLIITLIYVQRYALTNKHRDRANRSSVIVPPIK